MRSLDLLVIGKTIYSQKKFYKNYAEGLAGITTVTSSKAKATLAELVQEIWKQEGSTPGVMAVEEDAPHRALCTRYCTDFEGD